MNLMGDLISRAALYKAWDALDETQDANLLIDAMIKAAQNARGCKIENDCAIAYSITVHEIY